MQAVAVPNSQALNLAFTQHGVSQAVLQAILDYTGARTFDLPDPAQVYARKYARDNRLRLLTGDDGVRTPESNIMGAAWYMSKLYEMMGNEWSVVSAFMGGGPNGRIIALEIQAGPYTRRWRQWR